jgi:hypothetical protein
VACGGLKPDAVRHWERIALVTDVEWIGNALKV